MTRTLKPTRMLRLILKLILTLMQKLTQMLTLIQRQKLI